MPMIDDSYYPKKLIPGLELSDAEREWVSQLTLQDLARIDNWLMSFAIRRGRKIAFLVMSSMHEMQSEIPNLPDSFYILRVQKLIEENRLIVSLGEIENWRGCEVILPPGEIEWK